MGLASWVKSDAHYGKLGQNSDGLVNVSEVACVVCDMEHWTRVWRTSSEDHIALFYMKSLN